MIQLLYPYTTTEKTIAGKGNGNLLQYSCLEDPVDIMKKSTELGTALRSNDREGQNFGSALEGLRI